MSVTIRNELRKTHPVSSSKVMGAFKTEASPLIRTWLQSALYAYILQLMYTDMINYLSPRAGHINNNYA